MHVSSIADMKLVPACVARAMKMLFPVLVLVACGSSGPFAPEGIFLPRLTGEPPHYAAALIEGTLVEADECLELTNLYLSSEFVPPSPGAVVLPLWPEGSGAMRTDSGGVRVDAPGLTSTMTGERVSFGGSFTSLDDAEQKVGEPIPANCQVGLYWVATPQRT
jgi:hypothetical protein